MAQADFLARRAAHFIGRESTFGTRANSMVRIVPNNGADVAAGLGREMIVDDRESVIRYDNAKRIKGLQNGAFGAMSFKLSGVPDAGRLGPGGTALDFSHHIVLEHGFGRMYAAEGCTVGTGSTTTQLVVDDSSNRRAGEIILVQDSLGTYHPAKVQSVPDATHINLVHALAGAPASGRLVRGTYTFVLAETRTSSLTIEQKIIGAAGREHRILGAFGTLGLAFPDAFGQPIMATLTGVGQHSYDGPTTLASPAFGSAGDATDYAPADDDMGVPFLLQPTVYLDATIERASDTPYRFEKFALEMMSSADPIPNPAAPNAVGGYIDTAGREGGAIAKVTLTIRCDPAEVTSFEAQSTRSLLMVQRNTDGSTLCLEFPRIEQIERPKPVSLGNGRRGTELVFNLLRDTSCFTSGNTAQDTDLVYTALRLAVG